MPLIKIETTLKELPKDFVTNLHKLLAPLMNKELNKLVTTLELGANMTVGDDPNPKIFLFRCWSFNVFNDLEKRKQCNLEIYKYLKAQLPDYTYDQIKVGLHDMPQIDIGPKPE